VVRLAGGRSSHALLDTLAKVVKCSKKERFSVRHPFHHVGVAVVHFRTKLFDFLIEICNRPIKIREIAFGGGCVAIVQKSRPFIPSCVTLSRPSKDDI
jgi:hypothetical protein